MDEVRMAAVVVKIATILAGLVIACKVIRAYVKGDDRMAKLEGVKIIEMKDGAVTKIEYEGDEYEYTEKFDAREGSIVQNLSVTLDAEIGAFYETDRRGVVVDDEGDSHDFINTYGRTFVKAQETARVKAGDLIRIVDKFSKGQPYDNGDVFTVSRAYGDGDIRVNNNSYFLLEQEYRVINPTTETPQVGDKIRVVDAYITAGEYEDGDVLKVTEVINDTGSVHVEGVDVGLIRREFEIVPSDTPVTKGKTEKSSDELTERVDDLEERVGKLEKSEKVSQTIEKGDTVRLDIPKGKAPRFGWGAVDNGEIGVVVEVDRDNEVRVDFPSQSYWRADVSELVVVSKGGETEQERKPVEGDIVVITDNTNGSTNEVGDIGIVTDIIGDLGSPCVKVRGRKHGFGYNHTKYSDMRIATKEEQAEYYRKEKAENLEKIEVNARELSFFRAGRDVGEHKKGDIVRVEDACGSPLIEGNLYELSYSEHLATISQGSSKWSAIVTLVTPVESRTDIEHDNE